MEWIDIAMLSGVLIFGVCLIVKSTFVKETFEIYKDKRKLDKLSPILIEDDEF